jgi:uncharacterized membrane protein YdjX (TVP38/TMEM64 family)
MAQRHRMPEHGHRKLAIFRLLQQLIQDAVAWSEAELAFTRADAKAFVRSYVFALALIFAGFAMLIAAIFTLAQTIVGALAIYVHGHTIAGLIVSFGLFGLTLLLLAAARYFVTRKASSKGMIFRRLTGVGTD